MAVTGAMIKAARKAMGIYYLHNDSVTVRVNDAMLRRGITAALAQQEAESIAANSALSQVLDDVNEEDAHVSHL